MDIQMDLETERTVHGLNKERNVLVFCFCCGSLQCTGVARGESWLARWCLMAPEGRWPFLHTSAGCPSVHLQRSTLGRPVSAGEQGEPWRGASSAMHDIKNSFT